MTIKPSLTVTKAQALSMLENWIAKDLDKLANGLTRPITNNALISLLSFSYNLGISRGELMRDRYNSGQSLQQIAETMVKYFHCNEVNPIKKAQMEATLLTRRKKEVEILLS